MTQLDDVLFPVEEHPVFVGIRNKDGERRLTVPDKKALVNHDTGRVLGVVSRGYRLVSNREALDWAYLCCRTAFPDTQPVECRVEVADAPATSGHCHIDLVHNSTTLDLSFVPAADKPDAFGPFVRVTNSYNGLRALAFDIGFHRKVCQNGLILPGSIVRFKFIHRDQDIRGAIAFEVNQERLKTVRTSFRGYLAALRSCEVPREDFERFVCAVLLIRKPKLLDPESRDAEAWGALCAHLGGLSKRYAGELGKNAYAVLNVITDFASRPPDNRCLHHDRHSLQRLAGAWLSTFSKACRLPGFRLSKYLEEFACAKAAPPSLPAGIANRMAS